jgi:hypothetical protein
MSGSLPGALPGALYTKLFFIFFNHWGQDYPGLILCHKWAKNSILDLLPYLWFRSWGNQIHSLYLCKGLILIEAHRAQHFPPLMLQLRHNKSLLRRVHSNRRIPRCKRGKISTGLLLDLHETRLDLIMERKGAIDAEIRDILPGNVVTPLPASIVIELDIRRFSATVLGFNILPGRLLHALIRSINSQDHLCRPLVQS